jgi:NADH-quinone oxidoreductase subunit J
MTAEQFFFFLFALGAVAGSLGVVLFRNAVNSAQSLVGAFFSLAGLYVLLQAEFIAVLQILVYAGAIMVLFLFVLMLLNLSDAPQGPVRVTVVKLLGVASAGSIAVALATSVLGSRGGAAQLQAEGLPTGFGTVEPIGQALLTHWVLPFELVGILLLAGLVGAVVVAKRRL